LVSVLSNPVTGFADARFAGNRGFEALESPVSIAEPKAKRLLKQFPWANLLRAA
jgi:hypothetical protein